MVIFNYKFHGKSSNFHVRFFFGHNIPTKNLIVLKFREKNTNIQINSTTCQLSVSRDQFKVFLRQFNFIEGYTAFRGDGMYLMEEEECTQLDVFGMTEADAEVVQQAYIQQYLQDDVYYTLTSQIE